jgi:nitric oxide reductase large subunit
MKKLWISFALVVSFSFAILGWIGTRIYQKMPPIPASVVSTDGTTVIRETSNAAKTSGKPWVAWKSVPSGATAVTSHPTGPPTGSIGKPRSS